jgi:hypothetical protein
MGTGWGEEGVGVCDKGPVACEGGGQGGGESGGGMGRVGVGLGGGEEEFCGDELVEFELFAPCCLSSLLQRTRGGGAVRGHGDGGGVGGGGRAEEADALELPWHLITVSSVPSGFSV